MITYMVIFFLITAVSTAHAPTQGILPYQQPFYGPPPCQPIQQSCNTFTYIDDVLYKFQGPKAWSCLKKVTSLIIVRIFAKDELATAGCKVISSDKMPAGFDYLGLDPIKLKKLKEILVPKVCYYEPKSHFEILWETEIFQAVLQVCKKAIKNSEKKK